MSHSKYDAIIFDRDDTLTHDVSWTYRLEDFSFVNGAPQAVKLCNDTGLLVFIATNQGGIGKGIYNVRDMHRFHWYLKLQLAQFAAWVDDIAFCPHYPHAPEDLRACACRKPNPGLVSQLCVKWELTPSRVLMVGDKITDVEAANRAGAQGVKFEGGNLNQLVEKLLAC